MKTKFFLQTALTIVGLTIFAGQVFAQGATTTTTTRPKTKIDCDNFPGGTWDNGQCKTTVSIDYETMLKTGDIQRHCGDSPFDGKWDSSECKLARNKGGYGPCAESTKKVEKLNEEFIQACADASFTSPSVCMNEARVCAVLGMKESKSSESDLSQNELLKSMGLANFFQNSSEKRKACSAFGQKDYDSEKRERSRTLRSVKEDMTKVNEKIAKDAEDYSDKKQKASEDFVEAQTKSREQQDEQQKQISEAGMTAQKEIMESEDQKGTLRSKIIELYGQKSNIIGARAAALADMSDAMISTKCMEELEALAKKLSSGMTYGLNSFLMNRGEKKRRLEATRDNCFAKAEAIRSATYRSYDAQLKAVDLQISDANRRIEALTNQATSIATNNQKNIARADEMQKKSNEELYAKQVSMLTKMKELEAAQQKRMMTAAMDLKNAEAAVKEASDDLDYLGIRPKGSKTPNEAAGKFRSLVSNIESLEAAAECRDYAKDLRTRFIDNAQLSKYAQEKDLSKVDKDDDDDDGDSKNGRD